ncbi:MAG: acyltransferase [Muribaculaceae bacterium]
MTSFYTEEELALLGLESYGKDVLISRKTSIYTPHKISIGDNVRIDDFCILSGDITFGSHIHIAAYCALYGAKGIVLEDYCGISSRSVIYSAVDDLSGDYLAGPNQFQHTINVVGGTVKLCKYAIIGTNSTIFPDLTINEGVVVGACSMVNKSLAEWGIYAGIPVKRLKDRTKGLLKYILQ